MNTFFGELTRLLKHDPGNRGILNILPPPDLIGLKTELNRLTRGLVITGFPIYGEDLGETDGPAGAANIASALILAGKEAALVTDEINFPLVKAAALSLKLDCEVFTVPSESNEFCVKLLKEFNPSHVIAIERPGKISGHFSNMRGVVIDHLVNDTDPLFTAFSGVKIAIGDGGNEMGMGSFKPYGKDRLWTDTTSDYPLAAGVSNWWGWGIGAIVSLNLGRNILPTRLEETELLRAIVEAGGIDGITKLNEMTVDGISLEGNLEVLDKIHVLVNNALERVSE